LMDRASFISGIATSPMAATTCRDGIAQESTRTSSILPSVRASPITGRFSSLKQRGFTSRTRTLRINNRSLRCVTNMPRRKHGMSLFPLWETRRSATRSSFKTSGRSDWTSCWLG